MLFGVYNRISQRLVSQPKNKNTIEIIL